MARVDRRRHQRAGAHARGANTPARPQQRVVEDTLFFNRLRRQGKWFFAVLAALFILSTALLGVGTGFGGLQDIIVNQQGSGGPSADDARERIAKNPKDAQAYRDLSTALQTEGKLDESIQPLATYVRLQPADVDAKRELAGLYLRQADIWRNQAIAIQNQLAQEAPGQTFRPSDDKLGQALGSDELTSARTAELNEQLNTAVTRMQASYDSAIRVYKQVAAAQPNDPATQFELAQAAEAASDVATAIAAYKAFVRLAPEDQSVPAVKQRIKQLEASTATSGG